jgi:hypothetical protein
MNRRLHSPWRTAVLVLVVVMVVASVLAAQCGAPPAVTRVANKEVEEVKAPLATTVPRATAGMTAVATAPPQPGEPGGGPGAVPMPKAYRVNRMIIKNADLSLLVADTDRAIDRVTQIAEDTFGYILTTRTWYQADFKYATITIGVPAEEFENALRRLRGLALKVLDENASGSDVSDEYVDLESRLRNLEATEARIRSFLDKADKVEEALRVNQELAEVSAEIEQVKGRMNYLKDRAAYSTITVNLSPEIPTPTPTPTPTVTPTPTITPTPTQIIWRPGETFRSATGILDIVSRTLLLVLGDALIWIVVVLVPFALPIGLAVWLGVRLSRRRRRQGPDKAE